MGLIHLSKGKDLQIATHKKANSMLYARDTPEMKGFRGMGKIPQATGNKNKEGL